DELRRPGDDPDDLRVGRVSALLAPRRTRSPARSPLRLPGAEADDPGAAVRLARRRARCRRVPEAAGRLPPRAGGPLVRRGLLERLAIPRDGAGRDDQADVRSEDARRGT